MRRANGRGHARSDGPAEPLVLELRVHGVNNTPPHAMLDLPDCDIVQVEGDELGSFWRRSPGSSAPSASQRGFSPASVEREAYSWGKLARMSVGRRASGGGVVGSLVSLGTRILWAFLLPFALVNVAYWSRRLHYGAPARPGKELEGEAPFEALHAGRAGHSHAGGAWIFRIAGLAFTLLIVASATVVSMDLVAVQCQPRAGSPGRSACAFLPDALGFINGWSMGARMAILSLVPVGLLLGLYTLASRTRAQFELASRSQHRSPSAELSFPDSSTSKEPRWPLLSTPGFWNHSPVSAPAANLHLAAGLTLVAGLGSWHLAIHGAASWPFADVPTRPTFTFVAVYCALLLLYQLYVQSRLAPLSVDVGADPDSTKQDGPSRDGVARLAVLHLRLAVVAYGGFLLLASGFGERDSVPDGRPRPMEGMSLTISVLVGVSLSLVLIASGVRRASQSAQHRLSGSVVLAVLALLVVAPVTFLHLTPAYTFEWDVAREHPLQTALVILVVPMGALWVARQVSRGSTTPLAGTKETEAQATGWGGRAPGVFLGIGLLLALMLSAAFVLLVGDRLNGNHSAGSLLDLKPAEALGSAVTAGPQPVGDPADLIVPQLYGWFTVAAALGLVVLGIVVGALALTRWRSVLETPWPAGTHALHDTSSPLPRSGGRIVGDARTPLARRVLRTRASMRLAHRAEPVLGLFLGCVLGAWLVVTAARQLPALVTDGSWPGIVTGATALITFAVIGMLIGGGTSASTSSVRPLGVLWDLACAVPRAAHPLGPPCYGERVVPEVLARCRWWLASGDRPGGWDTPLSQSDRSVVLSAHSLGGVICVAAILGAPLPTAEPDENQRPADWGDWMVPRLGLITYGTQLRAYFSRFFPELFGPRVLGVAPARRARLFAADPWECDWLEGGAAFDPPEAGPGSVRHLLSLPAPGQVMGGPAREAERFPRWYSLWRLTDYLGFPLVMRPLRDQSGGPESPAVPLRDWYAQEIDHSGYLLSVLTHSDYPRTDEYGAALAALVDELSQDRGRPRRSRVRQRKPAQRHT